MSQKLGRTSAQNWGKIAPDFDSRFGTDSSHCTQLMTRMKYCINTHVPSLKLTGRDVSFEFDRSQSPSLYKKFEQSSRDARKPIAFPVQ